jgi:hypothetical protein
MLKIDTFVEKQATHFPLRFIKADVQSYELAVLKGMPSALERNPAAVLALEYAPQEIPDLGFQPEELLNWLAARDYQAYSFAKDGSLAAVNAGHSGTERYEDLLSIRRGKEWC